MALVLGLSDAVQMSGRVSKALGDGVAFSVSVEPAWNPWALSSGGVNGLTSLPGALPVGVSPEGQK